MMTKPRMLALLMMAAGCFSSVYAYNEAQLKQFEETNKCNHCDLSSAKLTLNHSKAELAGANLSGVKFQYGNLALANLSNANLSGADLYHANFSQANLTGAHFDGAYLYYANLSGATGTDLTNARVCKAILPDGSEGKCND